ncbi:MAG TPA: PilZ domain-containing protein [Sphingomicrobium sp.]|nr:PilZ domain-containing protein [Sphingomicrobium sp.]
MEQLPVETTVYSLSSDPPVDQDRREEERHLTLFRVGAIVIGGRRELCLVKNISAGGALIRAYSGLAPKQKIRIELKEGQQVAGLVNWVRGNDAGLTFDSPVDVLDLLKSSGEGPRPRMPRVEVRCVGFVREGAILHRVNVLNISQGGIKVESAKPLTVGGDVTATLPGLPPQGGVVRWNDGESFGIGFNSVLALAGLVEWLNARER